MNLRAAVDPGETSGVAFADGGRLVRAVSVKPCALSLDLWYTETCTIEIPRVYPGGKARPADLITLAVTAGRWEQHFRAAGSGIEHVFPADWKGQVPKPKPGKPYVIETRIRKRLSADECRILDSVSGQLDAIDAIGILLYSLGRFP